MSDQQTLLQAAIKSRSTDIVKFLLERGANPNEPFPHPRGVGDRENDELLLLKHCYGRPSETPTLLHTALDLDEPQTVNQMLTLLLDHGKCNIHCRLAGHSKMQF